MNGRPASDKEVPPWIREPFIHRGYRTAPTNSLRACLLYPYFFHNETANILTHLSGALYFLYATYFVLFVGLEGASTTLRVLFACFTFCGAMTFTVSTTFHTLLNHSKEVFDLLRRTDLAVIVLFVGSSFLPPLWMQFHCNTLARVVYVSTIILLTAWATQVVLSDNQKRWKNILLFSLLSGCGVIPMFHTMYYLPYQDTVCPTLVEGVSKEEYLVYYHHLFMSRLFVMYGLYTAGATVYLTRVPERLFPGFFDIFGSSHQLMHLFVMAAPMYQLRICLDLFTWTSALPCCDPYP